MRVVGTSEEGRAPTQLIRAAYRMPTESRQRPPGSRVQAKGGTRRDRETQANSDHPPPDPWRDGSRRRRRAARRGGALSRLGGLAQASTATASAACVLTPEQTEGPFYLDLERIRRNIAAGKSGVPLVLRTRVIGADSCEPIHDAAVDIWHCDALGKYSGEASEGTSGQSYLRGV